MCHTPFLSYINGPDLVSQATPPSLATSLHCDLPSQATPTVQGGCGQRLHLVIPMECNHL